MKVLFTLIITFLSLVSLGQNQVLDSLNNVLKTSAEDTVKVEILLQLAYQYRNIDADKSLSSAQEALALADDLNYAKGQVLATRNIGMAYYKAGAYDTAIVLCKKAIELATQTNRIAEVADAYNTLGNIYYYKGELARSVDAYSKAIPIFDSLGRNIDMAGNLGNMGVILENQGKYAEALANFQKALPIFEQENHLGGKAMVLFSMANIYNDQNEYEKALELYNTVAELDKASGDLTGYATTLTSIAGTRQSLGDTTSAILNYTTAINLYKQAGANCRLDNTYANLGNLYNDIGNLDSARYYLNLAINVASECDNNSSLVNVYQDMGDYYMGLGKLNQAQEYYGKAYDMANEIELKPAIAQSAAKLYSSYKASGRFAEALKYYEISTDIDQEIFNEKNTRELSRLEAEYEFEKERQDILFNNQLNELKLNEKIEQQSLIQWLTTIFLVVVIVLAVVIARLYFNKKKAHNELALINEEVSSQNEEILQQQEYIEEKNKLVEKSNEHLKTLNEEKNTIIGIVAHDLKAPINQIRGLVDLAKNIDPSNAEDYLSKMSTAAERSVAMIDQILNIDAIENRDLKIDKSEFDISKLIEEVKSEFKVIANKKNIEIAFENNTSQLINSDKRLLKEIIENLLSNAIKFSNPSSKVSMGILLQNGATEVFVSDHGPGISEKEQAIIFEKYQRASAKPTAGESSSGLGLAIVKRYADEIGADVTCESSPGKGTTFIIKLPK